MRLYIAGPMRGMKNANAELFNATADKLREQGFVVFNPAEQDYSKPGNTFGLDQAMAFDLPQVCKADALVILPGVENSQGARIEIMVALMLGKPIWSAKEII